eukprot:Pompholyxophrys_sp_v1_NODE_31_length_3649_cov_4.542571.p1 type:complete len:426 gc:universal NODE_31_length_3649_cov_4.542571:2515-1238(-)
MLKSPKGLSRSTLYRRRKNASNVDEVHSTLSIEEKCSPFNLREVESFHIENYESEASLNIKEEELAIISFILRHKLSARATDDLIKLSKVLSPNVDIPPNFAFIRKKFTNDTDYVVKYICRECNRAKDINDVCICGTIPMDNDSFFVTFKMSNIVCEKMKDQEFRNDIKHKLTRTNSSNMEDIYDSQIYKSNPELMLPGNMGIGLNTDGVQLFKKSSYAFWPLFALFYDLPPTKRYKFKNIALAGMWFGHDKPNMNLFLQPCVDDINNSESAPLLIANEATPLKLFVITISADLPAKALLLNSHQYNGVCGCHQCEEEGVICEGSRCWPWVLNPHIRTPKSMLHCVQEAIRTGIPIKGVKGPSILSTLLNFQVPVQVIIDYMHMFAIGVGGKMLDLLFNTKYHKEAWYLRNKLDYVDQVLTSIKV